MQIAQALIKELKNPRILCLCYTNHALDDFLLSLHEDGLPLDAIIRLGKSPKINDKLKDRCLNDLPEVAFNRVQSRSFAILKKKLESDKSDINKSKNALAIRWGAKSWDHVRIFFIEHDYSSYLNQLSLPTSSDPTFEISGKKNKSIKPNYFWQEWCQGKSRREIKAFPLQVDEDEGGLWRLSKLERLQKIAEWQQEWVAPRVRSLKSCIESFEKNDKQLAALRTEAKVGTAVSATVLGCTTTSAAKNNDLIAQIRPNVIIIEEAAEILEANVITAINQYAEKLIMIGDHKQLRPKLESYNLRVDSGKGINFDVSLFERLAKEGQFPIHTLQVQHRMRPEISAIIRKNTYPDLVDHESVLHRDSIRGMDENCNVLFLNHDQKESYDEQAAMLGTSSKVNQHEADLAVAIVKYYLWQGYTESDLVILTPYLGQLMQIRNALKQQELDVSLSDLDRNDMKKLDLEETNTSNNSNKKSIKDESSVTEASDKSSCVRAATVDNFQGEEAKIVIISLVRCNDDKDIGFVNGAERINVMLSRARDGMCIIGSRNTFENASSSKGRQLWRKIFSHFDEHGLVYNSFPAQCYNHKVSTPSIYCSEDFTKMVPHGGCLQTCGFVLPTCPLKHTCTLRCHPLILARDMINSVNQDISTVVHKKMNCKEIVQERCANTINADLKDAHYVERVCSEKNVPLCRVLVPSKCVAGHYLRVECYRSGQSLSVKSCDYCKQLLKNAEIRRKQQREEEDRYRKELENIENEISLNKELLEQEKNREVQRIALARAKREKILLDRKLSADIERRKDLPIEDTTFDFTEDDFELLKPSSPATANSTIDTKNRLAHNAAEVGESNSSFAAGGGVVSSLSADVSQPRIESASNTTVLSSKAYTTDSVARSIHSTDSSQIKASSKSIIKEMITMAEKNSWLALHDKVEAMEKDTSFDRVILRLFSLLISINLGEMLQEEAEYFMTKLSKNRMTSSDIDNLKFILTLYINFKIAATNLRYLETAINYGERFLKIAENSERYKCFTVSLPPHWRTEVEEKCNELKSLNSKPTTPGTSSAADEWKRCKLLITSDSSSKSSVEAIDEMMKLTGLETVKRDFLNEYERICIAKERGESGALASYNTVLIGNPGTGALILFSIGIRYQREFVCSRFIFFCRENHCS